MMKLATGIMLDHFTDSLAKRLFPFQFGLGTPAGAEGMLRLAQTLAAKFPDRVMVATDVKNAFGTLHRASGSVTMCP